jgi:hypothetical protein
LLLLLLHQQAQKHPLLLGRASCAIAVDCDVAATEIKAGITIQMAVKQT